MLEVKRQKLLGELRLITYDKAFTALRDKETKLTISISIYTELLVDRGWISNKGQDEEFVGPSRWPRNPLTDQPDGLGLTKLSKTIELNAALATYR